MKHPLFQITILFLSLFSLSSCGEKSGANDEPEPPAKNAPRTVLVYMEACNSLGSSGYDRSDLNEMITAARNGDIADNRLLVFHHPKGKDPVLKEIQNLTGNIDTLVIYDSSISSVSSRRMEQVIADAKRLAPADDYGLVLWSHGNGWIHVADNLEGESTLVNPNAFGVDETLGSSSSNRRYMNTDVLGATLRNKGFSFIYFDCCYMACVEVMWDMRGTAPFIVASSTELPAAGMPYNRNIKCFMAPKKADIVGAARNTFELYDAKSGIDRTCTISVIDMSAIDRLADATRAIYSLHPSLSTGFSPQKFMTENNCYYYDFGHYVNSFAGVDPSLVADWNAALDATIVYKASTPRLWDTIDLTYHSGLSTQIIDSESKAKTKGYDQLLWWKDVASYLWR